jgi:rod shape-determining protein MreB
MKYIVNEYKILIGEKTAENAKIQLGCVFNPNPGKTMIIKGRHLLKGLPEAVQIKQTDLYKALLPGVMEIVTQVKAIFENTPPELAGDILESGIVLTGGGSMIKGLDTLISDKIKAPCRLADNPTECVARGTAIAFKYSDTLLDGFEKVSMYKYR